MTGAGHLTALEANALSDGELSGDAAAEARVAVASDDELRGAAAWRDTLNAQLHAAYDAELSRPLPARTRRLLAASAGWSLPSGTRRIAAALAIAATAAVLGYGAGALDWRSLNQMDRVVSMGLGAHQVYAGEIRHPVEVAGSESAHLAKWLGARLGVPFTAPDITDTGFALVGGRLLAEGQRPAALLMYEDSTGRRVSLYMEKWPNSDETEIRQTANGAFNTFYWVDKNFACAVSSNLDPARLKVVSEQLYASLERG